MRVFIRNIAGGIVVGSIARCIIFGVPRLPIRPCDERPPAMYGHFCLVPRVSVHDRYYCRGNAQYVRGVRVSVHRGRAMSAKFLSTRVMVMIVLMTFLAACKARNGNFMPTFFRYMI